MAPILLFLLELLATLYAFFVIIVLWEGRVKVSGVRVPHRFNPNLTSGHYCSQRSIVISTSD